MLVQIGAIALKPTYHDYKAINEEMLRGASGAFRGVYEYYRNAQALADLGQRGWIRPRNDVVAAAIGVTRRTVIRAKQWLAANGLIQVGKRFRRIGVQRRRMADWIKVVRKPSLLARLAAKFRAAVGAYSSDKNSCDIPGPVTAAFLKATGRNSSDIGVTAGHSFKNKITEAEIEATKQTPEFKARMAELRACRAESVSVKVRE